MYVIRIKVKKLFTCTTNNNERLGEVENILKFEYLEAIMQAWP
jgi:hypothetical protein